MKINIKRFKENQVSYIETFEVENKNLLKNLFEIKSKLDNSLSFRCSCKSGICGSCTVRVNGVEKLACKTIVKENDLIEPIKNCKVIKDLIVDVSHETVLIKRAKAYINKSNQENNDKNSIAKIELQSSCILCNACYSSCPVYEVNKEFLGPFALTKALRYVNDNKNLDNKEILDAIQQNGIWDCVLCSSCTFVCPQRIDSKTDILNLQNISSQNGYENPNLQNDMNFDDDFGFNPNSF